MTISETAKSVRVATVQLALSRPGSPDIFYRRIESHVRVAADYGADFVCFPEHVTLQLLAAHEPMVPAHETVDALSAYTDAWQATLRDLAARFRINIIGGSHATRLADGAARNIAYVAHRDRSMDACEKIHPTPDERDVWGIDGGTAVRPIQTDCATIGVLICYDSEFPELSRRLVDQVPIDILFVPYLTDARAGHFRVRYCCHARTIENQHYVVTAGMVGSIGNVANLDMAYAQSAILTPNDMGFARDGIAAQAEPQVEEIIFADLDLNALERARRHGAVRNLADRRSDLYRVDWKAKP